MIFMLIYLERVARVGGVEGSVNFGIAEGT